MLGGGREVCEGSHGDRTVLFAHDIGSQPAGGADTGGARRTIRGVVA